MSCFEVLLINYSGTLWGRNVMHYSYNGCAWWGQTVLSCGQHQINITSLLVGTICLSNVLLMSFWLLVLQSATLAIPVYHHHKDKQLKCIHVKPYKYKPIYTHSVCLFWLQPAVFFLLSPQGWSHDIITYFDTGHQENTLLKSFTTEMLRLANTGTATMYRQYRSAQHSDGLETLDGY